MALNGVFNIGAWVFFFAGMQRIGATRASMLTSVDPIFSAILAYLLFNQFFSAPQWVGFFLVIISLFCFEYFKKKYPDKIYNIQLEELTNNTEEISKKLWSDARINSTENR